MFFFFFTCRHCRYAVFFLCVGDSSSRRFCSPASCFSPACQLCGEATWTFRVVSPAFSFFFSLCCFHTPSLRFLFFVFWFFFTGPMSQSNYEPFPLFFELSFSARMAQWFVTSFLPFTVRKYFHRNQHVAFHLLILLRPT